MTAVEEQELKIWNEHQQTKPGCQCDVCARMRELSTQLRLVLSSRSADDVRKLLRAQRRERCRR